LEQKIINQRKSKYEKCAKSRVSSLKAGMALLESE